METKLLEYIQYKYNINGKLKAMAAHGQIKINGNYGIKNEIIC